MRGGMNAMHATAALEVDGVHVADDLGVAGRALAWWVGSGSSCRDRSVDRVALTPPRDMAFAVIQGH